VLEELKQYAKRKQTDISLVTLMQTGQGKHLNLFDKFFPKTDAKTDAEKVQIQVANFLYRELPVRLAHRALELESEIVNKSSHVRQVCNWYKRSFEELRKCPAPTTLANEVRFSNTIEGIYERHSSTLINMAKGAHQIRAILKQNVHDFADYDEVQRGLNDFYQSRIGIRLLIGQYLALKSPPAGKGLIGMVNMETSPFEIAQAAVQDARYICMRTHGDAPDVSIHGRTDLTFPYVPSHISYILVELLKNSMRATVEYHGLEKMPSIRIVIADGEKNEDVVIKVSDEGGGIPRSHMKRIWSYLFTTADPAVLESIINSSPDVRDFDTQTPLAGLGYGLPISRNYARYFGGDLVIMSMEGYGTDSFIYLKRLMKDAIQPIVDV
jgi:pyruvate dehydrogenase kinase 2/3/4